MILEKMLIKTFLQPGAGGENMIDYDFKGEDMIPGSLIETVEEYMLKEVKTNRAYVWQQVCHFLHSWLVIESTFLSSVP